ncbi:hypothetical protein MKW94_001086 [Papaver nudicaule]|uniref:Anaphase-promoting complex subunit 11 RING-H2 finger domain-containing protein n=1 Tax=Papaver nudicaule TaxID=74823 RepID=A0AA42B2T4_PAPNU|nr:hypothetical protein [Papaver nudicaule]
MKVKILQWHGVASWTWDAQDETCGIYDCPLIWGACDRAFHLHCILKWVNSQTPQANCPMCRREEQTIDALSLCVSKCLCVEVTVSHPTYTCFM